MSDTAPCPASYSHFVSAGREIAVKRKIVWDIPLDTSGQALDGVGWDLTAFTSSTPPPRHLARDFGWDKKATFIINHHRTQNGLSPLPVQVLAIEWIDLIKAYIVEALFVRQIKSGSLAQFCRALRMMATVAPKKKPFELTLDDVRSAIELADHIQPSGTLSTCIRTLVKTIFDLHHLCPAGPFSPLLIRPEASRSRRAQFTKQTKALATSLNHSVNGQLI